MCLSKSKERNVELIQSLAGVVIWTENLHRLSSFYQNALDMKPHSVRSGFVAFQFGDTRLSLGKHDNVVGKSEEPYRVMVNLGVADIHEAFRTLESRGVVFIRSPEKEHWGGWIATFFDPDGNILQLLQPLVV